VIRRVALFILAICWLARPAAFASTLQQRIEQERRKAALIQQRLQQKRRELHAATLHVGDLRAQLQQTTDAIAQVQTRLGMIEARERSIRAKLAWNTLQLRAAQRSLALQDRLYKQRLVGIYEGGDLGYLAVLLSATSFADFVERWEDLRLVISADQRTVAERRAAARKVAAMQRSLERTQYDLERQQQAQQEAENQLDTLAQERRNLVALADAQRRAVAVQVANMEDISAAEEARLEALIRERQAELAAQERARRAAAGIAGTIPPQRSGAPSHLDWPVTGTITSPFGWRQNPFGGGPEFHPGLDIAAPMGTTVTAAASGTVIMAQWYGGYGNYILIDNGGGISTGYGHLSAIYVTVGQYVQQGQAIGAVGSTGYSTGPHLHFEVRLNGKPVDPTPWLH